VKQILFPTPVYASLDTVDNVISAIVIILANHIKAMNLIPPPRLFFRYVPRLSNARFSVMRRIAAFGMIMGGANRNIFNIKSLLNAFSTAAFP
jgi:hypothetical protein